jgi:hypothetical protein
LSKDFKPLSAVSQVMVGISSNGLFPLKRLREETKPKDDISSAPSIRDRIPI